MQAGREGSFCLRIGWATVLSSKGGRGCKATGQLTGHSQSIVPPLQMQSVPWTEATPPGSAWTLVGVSVPEVWSSWLLFPGHLAGLGSRGMGVWRGDEAVILESGTL